MREVLNPRLLPPDWTAEQMTAANRIWNGEKVPDLVRDPDIHLGRPDLYRIRRAIIGLKGYCP